jgi:hypothetical protein
VARGSAAVAARRPVFLHPDPTAFLRSLARIVMSTTYDAALTAAVTVAVPGSDPPVRGWRPASVRERAVTEWKRRPGSWSWGATRRTVRDVAACALLQLTAAASGTQSAPVGRASGRRAGGAEFGVSGFAVGVSPGPRGTSPTHPLVGGHRAEGPLRARAAGEGGTGPASSDGTLDQGDGATLTIALDLSAEERSRRRGCGQDALEVARQVLGQGRGPGPGGGGGLGEPGIGLAEGPGVGAPVAVAIPSTSGARSGGSAGAGWRSATADARARASRARRVRVSRASRRRARSRSAASPSASESR